MYAGFENNQGPSLKSIIFPSASQNISKVSAYLSKSNLSIRNRLNSIQEDSEFIRLVAKGEVHGCEPCRGLPVVANERCGGWYVDPGLKVDVEKGSCYFKSTDGHFNQWNFSLRRLNLHILDVVGEYGGCIIVDSTRRGKHLPDALSKTIPIWCSVINWLLFPSQEYAYSHGFKRLQEIVGASEQAQIEARLPNFVESAKKLDLPLEHLKTKLRLPIQPIWIARSLGLPRPNPETTQDRADSPKYHPIYLCTASAFQSSLYDESSSGYVQGAGDDNESWSRGLTSALFWENREALLAASEDELPELIEECITIDAERRRWITKMYPAITQAPWLHIGTLPATEVDMVALQDEGTLVIACAPEQWRWPGLLPDATSPSAHLGAATVDGEIKDVLASKSNTKRLLHLHCGAHKIGSKDLRKELINVPCFFERIEQDGKQARLERIEHFEESHKEVKVVVCCPTGKDLAVGVALAVLCLFADDEGNFSSSGTVSKNRNVTVDKSLIKRKLSWIVSCLPAANPSRATLNSVNAFLMS